MRLQTLSNLVFFCVIGLSFPLCRSMAGTETDALIARLDRIRIPEQAIAATMTVRRLSKPSEPIQCFQTRTFLYVGKTATLLIATDPPKDAGKKALFREDGAWFFDPLAKHPVRIAPGQAGSQPLAFDSPNWRLAKDFAASLIGKEEVECGDGKTRACAVIDFTLVSKALPAPPKMRYWVDDTGRYRRIMHFTASGKLLRTIDAIKYQSAPVYATGMQIHSGSETVEVTFSEITIQNSPREWFEPPGIPPLQP